MTYTDLEKLHQKATPAPWTGDRRDGTVKYHILSPIGAVLHIEEGAAGDDGYGFINPDDAMFVMVMRNALPSLLLAAHTLAKLRSGEVCDGQVMLPAALFAKVHAACSWNFNALTVVSNEELALLSKLQEQHRAMLSATGKGDK